MVSRDQVVFMDDMAVNPVGVLEEVLNFLGLDLTDDDGSKVIGGCWEPGLPWGGVLWGCCGARARLTIRYPRSSC